MKTKILLIGFLMLFFSTPTLKAQEDTIYYDAGWRVTVKDSAAFYRIPVKQEGDLYRLEDYYITGQLQMSGLSKSKEKANWEGKVTWYNEDGTMRQEGNYKNSKLHGTFISFLNKEKLISNFTNGVQTSGSRNFRNFNSQYYTTVKNDTVKEVIFDKDINGIRYETYRVLRGQQFLSKYYDVSGKLIGERKYEGNGYYDGLEVFYYYKPMRVRQINYYPNGQLFGTTFYYPNGNIRTKFEQKPEYKKTFFNQEGKELGSATYKLDRDYLKPFNGTEYYFPFTYKEDQQGIIRSIKFYKEGILQKEEVNYDNGKTKSVTTYVDNIKDFQVSYDDAGNEIARMQYKNYYPFDGTEITQDRETTYKDGEFVSETNYYPKTKLVFSKKTQTTETYYSSKGNLLGSLEVKYENNYAKPMNGKRFYTGYNNSISSEELYKDGYISERTTYRSKQLTIGNYTIFKRKEFYETGSFSRLREIRYYSNDTIQSDIEYKGYDKIKGTFYAMNGELLGVYDFEKKDGDLYEFFNESDVIRLQQKQVNGKLVSSKRYNYGSLGRTEDVDAILEEEIDVNCCAKTYTSDGELFAEVTFKDGKPWEGTMYDDSSRALYTINQGLRNGVYKKYDYNKKTVVEEGQYTNDKKEGEFKFYNYDGILEHIETYKEDQLNGKAIYFDIEGKEVSRLIYKDNNPIDGVKTIKNGYSKKPTEQTYAAGLLVKKVSYDDNGKRVTKYKEGKAVETIAYHKNSNNKRLSYTMGDYYVNGEVVSYDSDGKEKHRATFINNKLASGIVYLKPIDNYDKRVVYIILEMKDNTLKVIYKDRNDKAIFTATEDIEAGYTSKYISKLNIYTDNVTPESLY